MIKNFFLLFFLSFSLLLFSQKKDYKRIDFTKVDSVAKSYHGETLKNLPLLTHNLTKNETTDVEKFRAIFKWVSENIKGSSWYSEENISKRKRYQKDTVKLKEWNKYITKKMMESLLHQKKTVCTGYAYLIKEMCFLSGIECVIVDGYAKTLNLNLKDNPIPNHSWNAVKLNNKWYLCDATWASGFSDKKNKEFVFDYRDVYFLTPPEIFIKDHYPIHLKWTLLNHPPSLESYIKAPLIYRSAYKYKLIPVLPDKMFFDVEKDEMVVFELKNLGNVDVSKIKLVLYKGFYSKKIQPSVFKNSEQIILKHAFDKKGKYDVHLKIGKDIVCTYIIKVN